MNYDLGFMIWELGFGRFMDGSEKGSEFVRFALESGDAASSQKAALLREFKPEERFVSFLKGAADFVNPGRFAARPTSSPVQGSDRSCGAQDLIGENLTLDATRQGIRHLHHPQCKFFSSIFEFLSS